MNETRRSFLGSIGALLSGIPFLSPGKKKVKETFSVKIEEIGDQRWRATLKTSGFFGGKLAVIDSPEYSDSMPVQAYAKVARLFLMFEIQRAMKIHVFPEDKHSWNNPMARNFSPESFPKQWPGWLEIDCAIPDKMKVVDYQAPLSVRYGTEDDELGQTPLFPFTGQQKNS